MARYRIIRRESFVQPGMPMFDVEERCWIWWEPKGTFTSLAAAELHVIELTSTIPVKRKIIKEYN
jgi:hypothetical protein